MRIEKAGSALKHRRIKTSTFVMSHPAEIGGNGRTTLELLAGLLGSLLSVPAERGVHFMHKLLAKSNLRRHNGVMWNLKIHIVKGLHGSPRRRGNPLK